MKNKRNADTIKNLRGEYFTSQQALTAELGVAKSRQAEARDFHDNEQIAANQLRGELQQAQIDLQAERTKGYTTAPIQPQTLFPADKCTTCVNAAVVTCSGCNQRYCATHASTTTQLCTRCAAYQAQADDVDKRRK